MAARAMRGCAGSVRRLATVCCAKSSAAVHQRLALRPPQPVENAGREQQDDGEQDQEQQGDGIAGGDPGGQGCAQREIAERRAEDEQGGDVEGAFQDDGTQAVCYGDSGLCGSGRQPQDGDAKDLAQAGRQQRADKPAAEQYAGDV